MIYYVRAVQRDWPTVENLAIALGLAQRSEDGTLVGDGWVLVKDLERYSPSGERYVHANLVYDGSLRALAESKAAEHPELAAALQEVPRYFVTDAEGNPVAPQNPYRVIF